ncbi:hypothetical protein CYK37_01820 [Mesorhizobium loti]|nr:hypothetical protein CYK37_01820 [Mesorhizobium loti]
MEYDSRARKGESSQRWSVPAFSGNALSLCFYAIPDAKPLRTFAEIALSVRSSGETSKDALPFTPPWPDTFPASGCHSRHWRCRSCRRGRGTTAAWC